MKTYKNINLSLLNKKIILVNIIIKNLITILIIFELYLHIKKIFF